MATLCVRERENRCGEKGSACNPTQWRTSLSSIRDENDRDRAENAVNEMPPRFDHLFPREDVFPVRPDPRPCECKITSIHRNFCTIVNIFVVPSRKTINNSCSKNHAYQLENFSRVQKKNRKKKSRENATQYFRTKATRKFLSPSLCH